MKQSALIILTVIIMLAGCAGAPVGWGGSHEVTLANSKAITVVYDPMMGGYSKTQQIATEHCQKFKKEPVPTVSGNRGVLPTQTFECK